MQYNIISEPKLEETALALERENKRRERVYSYFPALRPALAESGDVSAPRPPQGGFASASAGVTETSPNLGALITSTRAALESLVLATGVADALDQAGNVLKAGREKLQEASQSVNSMGEDIGAAFSKLRGVAEEDDGMGDAASGLTIPEAEKLKEEGNVQYRKGRFQVALRLYEKAIQLDQTQLSYRSNRAAALIGLERYREAAEECGHVVASDPAHLRIHHRLGAISARPGGFDACFAGLEAVAKQMAKQEKGVPAGLQRLLSQIQVVMSARATAKEEFRMKRYDAAEATYSRALDSLAESTPKGVPPAIGTAVLLCNRAICRSKLEKHKEALLDADAALQIDKDYVKAAMMRSEAVKAINVENRAREVAERSMIAAAIRAAAGGYAVGADGVWGCAAPTEQLLKRRKRNTEGPRKCLVSLAIDVLGLLREGDRRCWLPNSKEAHVRAPSLTAGIDAAASATSEGATALKEQDCELYWEVGGEVTLSVGGGKQVRGKIVAFDWASGLHSVEERQPASGAAGSTAVGKRIHHLKLRSYASSMRYEKPQQPAGWGGGAGGPAAGANWDDDDNDGVMWRKLTLEGPDDD